MLLVGLGRCVRVRQRKESENSELTDGGSPWTYQSILMRLWVFPARRFTIPVTLAHASSFHLFF